MATRTRGLKFRCLFCKKFSSKANYHRHEKSWHLLCPKCLSLQPKSRHPCFGARTVPKNKLFSLRKEGEEEEELGAGIECGPLVSGVYIPIEMRADCVKAVLRCMAARELLDTDLLTPALFLLAHLRRTCIACQASTDSGFQDFHSCRLQIDTCLKDLGELTSLLFNIDWNDRTESFLRQYLFENTFP